MIEKKIFIGKGAFLGNVIRMFTERGWILSTIEDADFLCLTGGADISPKFYGENKLQCTYTDPQQDTYDLKLFELFEGKPKIGICRGAQLLNALSGGSMYQDVDGHQGQHLAKDTRTGELILLSSIHHQMMDPSDEAEIIATAEMSTRRLAWLSEYNVKGKTHFQDDPEVVYYDKTMSLCFQAHPEIGPKPCTDYFFDLIDEFYLS